MSEPLIAHMPHKPHKPEQAAARQQLEISAQAEKEKEWGNWKSAKGRDWVHGCLGTRVLTCLGTRLLGYSATCQLEWRFNKSHNSWTRNCCCPPKRQRLHVGCVVIDSARACSLSGARRAYRVPMPCQSPSCCVSCQLLICQCNWFYASTFD